MPRVCCRTYGPGVVVYLLITAITAAHFWGDSTDYAVEILSNQRFWEFGHLFWRPLGALLMTAAPAAWLPAADDHAAVVLLLAGVSWLAGLACVVGLRGLLRWADINGWPADIAVGALVVSHAFLNYAQTATPYVPGLAMLLVGCCLLTRAAVQPVPPRWSGVGGGLALGAAVGFWLLYLWALPAALLTPLFLGGCDRPRWRLALRASVTCALLIAACYAVALISLHITSADALSAWIADSAHDVVRVRGVGRAAFGLPRSYVHMGQDGVLFKRYLLADPLNPTSAVDLLRLSLWKIGLFYLVAFALTVGLLRCVRGRRMLGLLAIAAVPTLGFAIVWQGGDLERYLPLTPFFMLALGGLFALERVPLGCRIAAGLLILTMASSNLPVMLRPRLAAEQQRLLARVEGWSALRRPQSRLFYVRDEIESLKRNLPLWPRAEALPLEVAAAPGLADTPRWRQDVAQRFFEIWDQHGDVWIARRLLARTPRPEWNWVEGDDPALSWHDLPAFFGALETDAQIGGADGFLRVTASPANRQRLEEVARRPVVGLGRRLAPVQLLVPGVCLNRAGDHIAHAAAKGEALANVAAGEVDQRGLDHLQSQREIGREAQRVLQGGKVGDGHAGPRDHQQRGEFQDAARLHPLRQVVERIGADNQAQLGFSVLPAQFFQSEIGVTWARSVFFQFINTKNRVAGNGELQHLDALLEASQLVGLLVRRAGGRHEQHLIELGLFATLLGQDEVPQVHGIERAAENAQAHIEDSVTVSPARADGSRCSASTRLRFRAAPD